MNLAKCLKMREGNKRIIEEVLDEIEAALKDPKGVQSHQRRLAFYLSLGTIAITEGYLENLNVLKKGAKINHSWFKKKKENVKNLISGLIICPVENLKGIDNLLDLAFEIENQRNAIAYGGMVDEKILIEKINLFLKLKEKVKYD